MAKSNSANSYDEWSPLKEVVVGSPFAYEAHDVDLSFKLFHHDNAFHNVKASAHYAPANSDATQVPEHVNLRKRYIKELAEDVEELAQALRKLGIKVMRPTELKKVPSFQTPYWSAHGIPALNVRDQAIILGDEIVETAPMVRSRYFENDLLKPIFYKYFKAGSKWSVMPRPIMTDASFDMSYVTNHAEDVSPNVKSEYDVGYEMMIDAAQCLRFGKDIMVNVSTENHELGLEWLKQQVGDRFNFHKVYRMADSHIDSIVLPLRPGLLLLRNKSFRDKLPKPLQKWDVIYPPEPSEGIFPSYEGDDLVLTSKYIDLNVLSIDQNTVIVNSLFPELITTLEKKGFTVVPVRHRHRRLFGGGFHCFTLDTVREGSTLQSYF